MTKRGRLIELAIGAIALTGYMTFIYSFTKDLPLSEQLLVNFGYLLTVSTFAWYLIRGAKDKPKVVA